MRQIKGAFLTEAELELMQVLWASGPCTVAQVKLKLPAGRLTAYTTVSTVLRILVKKLLVSTSKLGRAHLYTATLPKADYEKYILRNLLERVFGGNPQALAERFSQIGSAASTTIPQLTYFSKEA